MRFQFQAAPVQFIRPRESQVRRIANMEKSNSSKAALVPQPLAMIMCDLIWLDSYSGKHSLLGCFSQLNSSRFPFTHDRMSVYVLLTEGHGNVKLRLQLVDVDEERPPVVRIEVEQPF